jgi:hypothetical protein
MAMERKATAVRIQDGDTPLPQDVTAHGPWRPTELGHDAAADDQPAKGGAILGWLLLFLFLATMAAIALMFLGY